MMTNVKDRKSHEPCIIVWYLNIWIDSHKSFPLSYLKTLVEEISLSDLYEVLVLVLLSAIKM